MPTSETSIALKGLRKRPVVDTATAETIGRVRGVRIDPVRSAVIGILVRGGDGGVVPLDQVQAIGQDAVTVPSASAMIADDETQPADTDAYGSRVLDEDGNELGKLTDLHITGDGAIHQVVIDGQAHDRPVMGIGSYAVIVGRARRAGADAGSTAEGATASTPESAAGPTSDGTPEQR